MDLLRQRAGLGAKGKRERNKDGGDGTDDVERAIAKRDAAAAEEASSISGGTAGPTSLTTSTGHINLFEDLERVRLLFSLFPSILPSSLCASDGC